MFANVACEKLRTAESLGFREAHLPTPRTTLRTAEFLGFYEARLSTLRTTLRTAEFLRFCEAHLPTPRAGSALRSSCGFVAGLS